MVELNKLKVGKVLKKRFNIPKTTVMDTITNVPLDNNGHPIVKKIEVEERKRVFKGFHIGCRVLLIRQVRNRREAYLREVIQ